MGFLIFIAFVFFLSYTALIFYYRAGWIQLPEVLVNKQHQPKTKVSIIIPARNEEANIKNVLISILSQYYPTQLMEIIVVDDHSTDQTANIVKTFSGVTLIDLKEIVGNEVLNAYKKRAIEEAIKTATGTLIMTTDADCTMQPYWLLSIVSYYEKNNYQLIASPVSFRNDSHWFKIFQSLDFMTMQGITGALAFHKNGAMCNGANLAYTKMAFNQVGGFKDIDDIASGDDMLLMYKIEKRFPNRISYLKCKEAIVTTEPVNGIIPFFSQRIRWASKATKFKDKRITWVLYFVYAFNALFLLLLLASLFNAQNLFTFFGLLMAKTILEASFLYPVSDFFNKKKELGLFYILQFIHIPYILISGFYGQMGKYQWKDRKVK